MKVPKNPYARRAMVVMPDREKRELQLRDKEPSFLRDEEICVVDYDIDELENFEDLDPIVCNLMREGIFRPGNVLVQNPFDLDSYRVLDTALEDLSIRKHFLFLELCQILGAKVFKIEQVNIVGSDSAHKVKADGGAAVASATTEAALNLKDSFESKLEILSKFSGSDPDIESAKMLVAQNNLQSDDNFSNLISLRSNKNNPVHERTVKLNVSIEAKRNIDVAMRVETAVAQGSLSVESEKSNKYMIGLVVHVAF